MKPPEEDEKATMKQNQHAESTEELNEDEGRPVGLNTPLRIGVALAVAGGLWFLASSLSKIETKLDAITAQIGSATSSTAAIERKQNAHELDDQNKWTRMDTRVSIIEQSGSPKTKEIESQLNKLENEFKVHVATSTK